MGDMYAHGLPIDTPHPLRHTTALMEASRLGRPHLVSWLLTRGAAPTILCGMPRGTPLHCALYRGGWEIARLLVNASSRCGVTDAYGRTPLHILAMEAGNDGSNTSPLEIASLLLAKGCHIDSLDYEGITALHYCVINDDLALAQLLLHYGANANALTPDTHVSPLMIAALEKNLTMATALLLHGANPHAPTREGSTPASILPIIAAMAEEATPTKDESLPSLQRLPLPEYAS